MFEQKEMSLGARITIAVFSLLFGAIMLLWAQGQESWKLVPAIFCFIIAGACILPQPIKGWCGNIVAIVVIVWAVTFLYLDFVDPKPDQEPMMFASLFGLPALVYLVNKYAKLFQTTKS